MAVTAIPSPASAIPTGSTSLRRMPPPPAPPPSPPTVRSKTPWPSSWWPITPPPTRSRAADTAQPLDTRLQNLAVRSDAVVDPVRLGTAADDTTPAGRFHHSWFRVAASTRCSPAPATTRWTSRSPVVRATRCSPVLAPMWCSAGSRDVITGGSGIDQIWATGGDGNRLSGMAAATTTSSSAAPATGCSAALAATCSPSSKVPAPTSSTAAPAADQFWLVSGRGRPASRQAVRDGLHAGEDLVGLRGAGLS